MPLNLAGLDRDLVGLGSYLVNAAGGCNDCHTNPPFAPGGDPFAGQPKRINVARYLAGGTPFGNGIVSRNITPDRKGLPAGSPWLGSSRPCARAAIPTITAACCR